MKQAAVVGTLLFSVAFAALDAAAQRSAGLGPIDAQTRWAFRSLSPATVSTPIVRLRDVASPLDPDMTGWQRLGGAIIGLVPVDGPAMVIERERLDRVIREAEATPSHIDWIGPTRIKVVYRPGEKGSGSTAARPAVAHTRSAVAKVAYESSPAASPYGSQRRSTSASPTVGTAPKLSLAAVKSIVGLVRRSLEQQYPEVIERYEVEIHGQQPELLALKSMLGLPRVGFLDEPSEGVCRVRVTGKNYDGPCQSMIRVTLDAHPTVVFPASNFDRGYRLRYDDLESRPMPAEEIHGDYVADPETLVGMEVRRTLRAERPISRDDVGSPILIRRGDLVEIRVMQGGITVTTDGKALQDGAESEAIEVEVTGQRRKRLVARVVQSGLVEIITRAPRVGP